MQLALTSDIKGRACLIIGSLTSLSSMTPVCWSVGWSVGSGVPNKGEGSVALLDGWLVDWLVGRFRGP